jgi:hypothetical protein
MMKHNVKVKAIEWKDAKRNGKSKSGKDRKQKEPTEVVLPFNVLVKRFHFHSIKTLAHATEAEWYRYVVPVVVIAAYCPSECHCMLTFSLPGQCQGWAVSTRKDVSPKRDPHLHRLLRDTKPTSIRNRRLL